LDKPALRAALRARRDAHVLGGASGFDTGRMPPGLRDRLSSSRTVAGYVAIGSEIDPTPLMDAAAALGARLALPLTTSRKDPIRFVEWARGNALVAGPFGLLQPASAAQAVEPDLILTPMLGFDRALNRLGQGAGHYDRAFATLPAATRIGVAWSVQEVDALAADPWDVPLHALVTEKEWIEIQ
jgi:5-formyltetrahydrofolate cyclo-ligase